jgi:hypothetical protein
MEDIFVQESDYVNAVSYQVFFDSVSSSLQTADPEDPFYNYTKMNVQRMKRLNHSIILKPELDMRLKELKKDIIFLVITEGWCGDSAQIVPLFHHMQLATEKINLIFVRRDENLTLMDRFLTGASRSIPKLLLVDPVTRKVLSTWGPRPSVLTEIVKQLKENGVPAEEKSEVIHKWYANDHTQTLQSEMNKLLEALK